MATSRIASLASAAVLFGCMAQTAAAQSLGYFWSTIVPVLAETGSYQSQIYVHNPKTFPITVTPTYTGAAGSATVGKIECPTVQVGPDAVLATSLAALCPALAPGANFGGLVLAGQYEIAAYTRAETPLGNGFSVEGFSSTPFYCNSGVRSVTGLVRQAAAPTYQSNCFVWNNTQGPARVVVSLLAGNGTLLVDDIVEIASNSLVRMLDIFATLGAPAGDYANHRATFESIVPIGGGVPAEIIPFCTVQNNSTFDADFRMGKCQAW